MSKEKKGKKEKNERKEEKNAKDKEKHPAQVTDSGRTAGPLAVAGWRRGRIASMNPGLKKEKHDDE